MTTLNVHECSALRELYCYTNKLTWLNLQGCSSINQIYCYQNEITNIGMNTLINTLPTRSSSNNSIIRVLFNTGESNVFTNDHVAAARAKYWTPYRWNGSTWVEILASTPGDVSGDGVINSTDVTLLISLLLDGQPSVDDYPAADYNGDGVINTTDATSLITYLLNN